MLYFLNKLIFFLYPKSEEEKKLKAFCDKYAIEAIAIGNGTGGRETETFIRGIGLSASIRIVMVNESGASVYSASEAARAEFSDYDLTVRGSVSIGRRLMDPLAELVSCKTSTCKPTRKDRQS